MSTLKCIAKIGGDIDSITGAAHLTVSGGFGEVSGGVSGSWSSDDIKNKKNKEHQIVVGNLTKKFINNRIIEWDSFKTTYYENGKLDPKYYDKFLNELNNIYIMPFFTVDENEIFYFISHIYNAKPEEIINGLQKTIDLNQSIKHATQHLFMVYKVHIERLIELFVELRNKRGEEINFSEMLENWHLVDVKNAIDTSSTILYFNFPPPSAKLEKTIPKINWHMPGGTGGISKKINKFLKASKRFSYYGFCPHASNERFKLLLKFPVNELIDVIIALEPKYKNIKQEYVKIYNKVIKLNKNHDIGPIKFNKIKVSPFNKKFSREKKIKCFESYIKAFIKMYKDLAPYLAKKEKSITKTALDINSVAADIQNIILN